MQRKLIILTLIIITIIISIFLGYLLGNLQAKSNEHCIDMQTVIDFDATETGLYLYTNDGNGYYWEK